MKNRKRFNLSTSVIAGILVVCMLVLSVSVIGRLSKIDFDYTDKEHKAVVTSKEELEQVLADGHFNGKDSDSDIPASDFVPLPNIGKHKFNILEIVPSKGMGTIGFTIEGWEPVDCDDAQMRLAYLDAFANPCPGDGNNNNFNGGRSSGQQAINNFNVSLNGALDLRTYVKSTGYYKYVGKGNGVYSKSTSSDAMVSIYYENKLDNNIKGTGNRDYIWAAGAPDPNELKPEDVRVSLTEWYNGQSITVEDTQYRNELKNNDLFIKRSLGQSDVEAWKEEHVISLVTRPIADVSVEDIDDADLIIINEGTNDETTRCLELYNILNKPLDNSVPYSKEAFSQECDFEKFDRVVEIYDRVVRKEDVAIVSTFKQGLGNGKWVDTNLKKLLHMLYFVKKDVNGTDIAGAGRDMFMDYMKRYVGSGDAPSLSPSANSNTFTGLKEKNGFMYQDFPWETDMTKAIVNAYYENDYVVIEYGSENNMPVIQVEPSATVYRSKSNTTDYMYIDEETGNLVVDKKNSGKWYNVDYVVERGGYDYKVVSWDNSLPDKYENWPWETEAGCLIYWWFHSKATDGSTSHIPVYFHYDKYAWHGGVYSVFDGDPPQSTYKNQSFSYENQIYRDNFKALQEALDGREVKREETDDTHTEQGGSGSDKPYYIAINIVNGDSVSKNKTNKNIFINDYEFDETDYENQIPISFKLKSSENITKLVLYVDDTPKRTYTVTSGEITDDKITCSDGLTLLADKDEVNNINTDTATVGEGSKAKNITTYAFKAEIPKEQLDVNDYKGKVNTKYRLELVVEPVPGTERSVSDNLTVVIREMFELD